MLEHFSTIICTGLFTWGLLILFWLYLNSKWQENQILGKPWSVSFVLSYRKSYNPLGLHLLGSQMRHLFKGWLLLCKLTNLSCRWEPISEIRKQLRTPCNWGWDRFTEQSSLSLFDFVLTVQLGNSKAVDLSALQVTRLSNLAIKELKYNIKSRLMSWLEILFVYSPPLPKLVSPLLPCCIFDVYNVVVDVSECYGENGSLDGFRTRNPERVVLHNDIL